MRSIGGPSSRASVAGPVCVSEGEDGLPLVGLSGRSVREERGKAVAERVVRGGRTEQPTLPDV